VAQCASGSQSQPGAPVYFQFDSTTVATFLPFAASIAWLGFLALPIGPVDTAKFCSVEPPATSMSATDWVSLGFPLIAKPLGAYDRLADYIRQQAFATYCVCSGTTSGTYAPWILSQHPLWYLKFGESVGATVAVDSSPNANNGAYSGATLGQTALMSGDAATSASIPNGAYMQLVKPTTPARWSGSVSSSMELWGKFTAPGVDAPIYDTYQGTNDYIRINMRTTGKVWIAGRDSAGTTFNSADSAASIAGGVVHQLDLVLDASAHTITLYVDAVQACQQTGLSSNSYQSAAGDHFVGYDTSSAITSVAMTAGHFSWFPGVAISTTTISDNKAAAGGTTIYQPPIYTPPPDGTPTGGTPPTCSTSQDVCNQLFLTDQLLLGLSTQLSMFQSRQRPMFYRVEAIHTGLTGSGVLTVLDILGLRVQLTTVPSGWGSTAETPRRLIPAAGSIQAGISGEYTDNFQVHYEDEVLMLGASWAIQIRYNLRPGIVATLTELVPGG
jgi:hypothetical protein